MWFKYRLDSMGSNLHLIKGIQHQAMTPSLMETNEILSLIEMSFQKKTEINYFLSNCDTYVLFDQVNRNQVLALVQVEFETSHQYWLQHVCTHPNYRNQGLMKRLLKHIIADVRFRYPKIKYLVLEVSRNAKIARYLYQSLGFKSKTNHKFKLKYN